MTTPTRLLDAAEQEFQHHRLTAGANLVWDATYQSVAAAPTCLAARRMRPTTRPKRWTASTRANRWTTSYGSGSPTYFAPKQRIIQIGKLIFVSEKGGSPLFRQAIP